MQNWEIGHFEQEREKTSLTEVRHQMRSGKQPAQLSLIDVAGAVLFKFSLEIQFHRNSTGV